MLGPCAAHEEAPRPLSRLSNSRAHAPTCVRVQWLLLVLSLSYSNTVVAW